MLFICAISLFWDSTMLRASFLASAFAPWASSVLAMATAPRWCLTMPVRNIRSKTGPLARPREAISADDMPPMEPMSIPPMVPGTGTPSP